MSELTDQSAGIASNSAFSPLVSLYGATMPLCDSTADSSGLLTYPLLCHVSSHTEMTCQCGRTLQRADNCDLNLPIRSSPTMPHCFGLTHSFEIVPVMVARGTDLERSTCAWYIFRLQDVSAPH